MRAWARWLGLLLLALTVTGCGGGGSSRPSDNAHIVLEEAYFEPDLVYPEELNLVIVTKNLGPRGATNARGWVRFLDQHGNQLGNIEEAPAPYSNKDNPGYWLPGWTYKKTYFYFTLPDNLHAIRLTMYWDNFSGDTGHYEITTTVPYKRQ